jgi:putative methionine-R-sulfoxide reductase with GAF domain
MRRLNYFNPYCKLIFSIALLLIALQPINAQTPLNRLMVRRLTTANGLLSNQVYSIHQDKKGLMWFGGKGLQSYDGYRFKTYVPFDMPQLISFIIDDADGDIYFGNGADLAYPTALYKVNQQNDSYTIFQDSILIEGKKQKLLIAHTPIKTQDGTVWFALYPNAYAVLKPHAKQLQVVSDAWHLQQSIHYRHTFEIWNNQYIWQSNPKDGVYRIDIKNFSITNAKNNPNNEKIFSFKLPELLSFSADLDTNFWLVPLKNPAEIFHLNGRTFKSKLFQFPTPNFKAFDYIHQIRLDKKGNVWITPSGHSGLARYNKLLDTLDIMHASNATENKLRHQYAYGAAGMNMFVDREHNVWYPGDGVQYFSPTGQQILSINNLNLFETAKNTPADKYKVNSGTAVDVVQMANKDIYISYCTAGLVKVDSTGNHPMYVDLGIAFECIRKMFTPDGTNLYFKDSYDKQMYVYNTSTKKTIQLKNDYLNTALVSKFLVDNDTSIFVADPYVGLKKYNPITNQTSSLPLLSFPKHKEWLTRCMLQEEKDKLWVSLSFCGIYLIDKYSGKPIDQFIPDIKNVDNKADANAITHIERWNADTILLCTFDGLLIYNTKTKVPFKIDIKNGLFDNYLSYCIADTVSKNIWINSAYKGLSKYNMLTKRGTIPLAQEGNFLSAGSRIGLHNINGDMIFFFDNGLSYIKKDKKFNNYKPESVMLTSVMVNGKVINSAGVDSKHVVLKPTENNITFNLSCLDFWSSESLTYYAYLEGQDTNYYRLDNPPQLVYKNLAAGNYTLHVKAAYQNGNFCENETLFAFNIQQVFYKTWWFNLLLLASIIYGIYFILKIRNEASLKLANLKNEKLQGELEVEQINNFFSNSLHATSTVDGVLWDVARNLIGKLGFEDCMIYLWNNEKTLMVQKAGYGIKNTVDEINNIPFDVAEGQGVVGFVMQHKKPVLIAETSKDDRYRIDEVARASEICVPILYNNQLIGIIDSEHSQKNFYTQRHLNSITTIASLIANKITALESYQQLETQKKEVLKMNAALAEMELSALRSQMNPHFIFNSLNSINSVVIENNIPLASDYLTKFSKLIRLILENSKSSLIPLAKELEALRLYLLMESIRFKDKFDYQIVLENDLDIDHIQIPPTTLQPFVENAIVHGLMHLQTKGNLQISIKSSAPHFLEIAISDNGIGRAKAAELKSRTNVHKSHGYQITKERIIQLHPQNDIKILDKVDEQMHVAGTTIIIQMHY